MLQLVQVFGPTLVTSCTPRSDDDAMNCMLYGKIDASNTILLKGWQTQSDFQGYPVMTDGKSIKFIVMAG